MTVTVTPLNDALGAEIGGVDITRPIDPADFAVVRQAFIDHGVVLFRDQPLDALQLAALARHFGDLQPHVQKKYHHPDEPNVVYMTNVDEKGNFDPVAAARGAVEKTITGWHSDLCYDEIPCWATFLHALEIPSVGGPTCFANTNKAFEALPQRIKDKLVGKMGTFIYGGKPGSFVAKAASTLPAGVDAPDPVEHPIVARHPLNGRPAIYANPGLCQGIVGMDAAESEALLQEVYEVIDRPEFRYEHAWRLGDTVIWDNLGGIMHVGRADYPKNEKRILIRTTVRGQRIEMYDAA